MMKPRAVRSKPEKADTVTKAPASEAGSAFWRRFAPKHPGHAPKYLQLRDAVLAGIREGFWSLGDRLPAEKDLALATGLSLGTVQKAYRELVQDGVVDRRQGRAGSFVNREPRPVDTVWHFLFSDERRENFFPVFPQVDRVHRHSNRGSWSMHLQWAEGEMVQIDRIVDIGHEFLVYSQFIIDARVYDQARKGKTTALEGINLRRELNLSVQRMTYDIRIEQLPSHICSKICVSAKTIGMVVEIFSSANPANNGSFQRIFIPRTQFFMRIESQAPRSA
ncbi:GntR family transcriptional regulator [Roseixanthobacter pseudopolyaromaticivorans]|uniref:GntR family transcriptional regulator n=1 Tax=Xanthobacteraceae TaxID=335928 RepID=UPI00372B2920